MKRKAPPQRVVEKMAPQRLQTMQQQPVQANKPIQAPFVDPAYDFTGWVLEKLPYQILRAAKHGAVKSHVIVGKNECVNCKRVMWTCDKKLEDTCADCDYLMHEENRDLSVARERRHITMGVVNPFADTDEPSDGVTLRR
jgi:hypothetical protein